MAARPKKPPLMAPCLPVAKVPRQRAGVFERNRVISRPVNTGPLSRAFRLRGANRRVDVQSFSISGR